jgi:hypothetical protein
MPNRMSKMISFRLSQEEYEQLLDACPRHGVRNVSELVRAAMNSLVLGNRSNVPITLQHQVRDLQSRVQQLSVDVNRLARLLSERELRETIVQQSATDGHA